MSDKQAAFVERFVCSKCLAIFRSGYPRCPLCGSPVEMLDGDPLVGTTLHNRYMISACVGEGGMGRVYKAEHKYTGKLHAIKVLFGDHAADPKMRARMEQEALAVGKLSHRNVIAVSDAAKTDDNSFYLVMDFVEGENLAKIVAREAPFTSDRVAKLTKQLCMGLGHAHDHKLVHRDFKSENVLVTHDEDGELAKIVDFGIAVVLEAAHAGHKLTSEGMVLGTPAFMSPEQSTGGKVDHRSDLFSLGVMMYEMLCGKLPFDGSPLEIARQNLVATAPPISERVPGLAVDTELERIALRLMEKRPGDRFQSAHEVLAVLDRVEVGLSVPRPRTVPHSAGGSGAARAWTSPSTVTSETPSTPSVRISQLPYEATIATPSSSLQLPRAASAGPTDELSYSDPSSAGYAVKPKSTGRFFVRLLVVATLLGVAGYVGAQFVFERTHPQPTSAFGGVAKASSDGIPEEDITYESEFEQGGGGADEQSAKSVESAAANAAAAAASADGKDPAAAASADGKDPAAGEGEAVDADEAKTVDPVKESERGKTTRTTRKVTRKERDKNRRRVAKAPDVKTAPKDPEPQAREPAPASAEKKSEPNDDFERYRRLYQQVGRALDNTSSPPPKDLVRAYLSIKFQSGIMNAELRKEYIRRLQSIKAGLKRWKNSQ